GQLRDAPADEAHAVARGKLIGRPGPGRGLGEARWGAEGGIGQARGTPAKAEEASEPEPPAEDAPHHKAAERGRVDTAHRASPFLQNQLGDVLESSTVRVRGWYPRPASISCQ